jgi:hypothetical protein
LLSRAVMLPQGMQLPRSYFLLFVSIILSSEERLHILDEGAGDSGREVEGFSDDHVRSDVAAAAQICLPLRAQLARLFPELSFEPT